MVIERFGGRSVRSDGTYPHRCPFNQRTNECIHHIVLWNRINNFYFKCVYNTIDLIYFNHGWDIGQSLVALASFACSFVCIAYFIPVWKYNIVFSKQVIGRIVFGGSCMNNSVYNMMSMMNLFKRTTIDLPLWYWIYHYQWPWWNRRMANWHRLLPIDFSFPPSSPLLLPYHCIRNVETTAIAEVVTRAGVQLG